MSATLEPTSHADGHHDEHGHGHMPFQAHHFDDPEQQFDSGKLGMWLFLVTEVLFFSGMFCAYALYRSLHPAVFEFSSQFLNEKLGAFNTGVLLFSSLSMAWGVRCAQLRQRTGLVIALAITLGCASIFLGVKAIEYSHKWDIGLLPAGFYQPQTGHSHEEHAAGWITKYLGVKPTTVSGQSVVHTLESGWLMVFSMIPALATIGLGAWYVLTKAKGDKAREEIAGPFFVTGLCFFVGVAVGVFFQAQEAVEAAAIHGDPAHVASDGEHGHDSKAIAEVQAAEEAVANKNTFDQTAHNEPAKSGDHTEAHSIVSKDFEPGEPTDIDVDQKGRAGLFFSIYYCMTGVHAIHILGGMLVLGWLLIRATKNHFNEQYFGPVDYVGLYWHLVDLIWIYLFPLLYLIK